MLAKPVAQKMLALADSYEAQARALRTAVAIMGDEDRIRARETLPAKLTAAIAQRTPTKSTSAKAAAPATKKRAKPKAQRRAQTATLLAQFNATRPVEAATALRAAGIDSGRGRGGGIGTLVRHGYLKAKGDGFLRTSQPFLVDPSSASSNGHASH
jgi:hypothetical protein